MWSREEEEQQQQEGQGRFREVPLNKRQTSDWSSHIQKMTATFLSDAFALNARTF